MMKSRCAHVDLRRQVIDPQRLGEVPLQPIDGPRDLLALASGRRQLAQARDLGILASTDLLAVDQASIDMVYKLPEAELRDLKERIESRKGLRQLSYMKELQMGNDRYELITI